MPCFEASVCGGGEKLGMGPEAVGTVLPGDEHSCLADYGGSTFPCVLWPASHNIPRISEHKSH